MNPTSEFFTKVGASDLELLTSRGVSNACWRVYFALRTFIDLRTGTACIGQALIGERAGLRERAVRRALKELLAADLIGVVGHGPHGVKRYSVLLGKAYDPPSDRHGATGLAESDRHDHAGLSAAERHGGAGLGVADRHGETGLQAGADVPDRHQTTVRPARNGHQTGTVVPPYQRIRESENSHSGDSLRGRTKEPDPAPADAGDVASPVGEEPEAAPTPPAAARTDPSRDADLDPGDLDYGIDRLLELPGWLDQLSTSPLIRRRYTERLARQYAVVHGAASLATWADVAIELNVQAQNEKRPFHAAAWTFAHVRGFAGGWEPKARDGSPRKFQEAVLACDPDAAMLAWRWSRACQAEERSAEVKATVDRDLQKLRSVDSVVAGELDDLEAHWKARAAEVA